MVPTINRFLKWQPDAQCTDTQSSCVDLVKWQILTGYTGSISKRWNSTLASVKTKTDSKKKQWRKMIFMSEKALCGFMVDFRVMPCTFCYFQLSWGSGSVWRAKSMTSIRSSSQQLAKPMSGSQKSAVPMKTLELGKWTQNSDKNSGAIVQLVNIGGWLVGCTAVAAHIQFGFWGWIWFREQENMLNIDARCQSSAKRIMQWDTQTTLPVSSVSDILGLANGPSIVPSIVLLGNTMPSMLPFCFTWSVVFETRGWKPGTTTSVLTISDLAVWQGVQVQQTSRTRKISAKPLDMNAIWWLVSLKYWNVVW